MPLPNTITTKKVKREKTGTKAVTWEQRQTRSDVSEIHKTQGKSKSAETRKGKEVQPPQSLSKLYRVSGTLISVN